MRIWIFSDLHLTEPSEWLYRSFLAALDEPGASPLESGADTVVFAGDIFDLFVGNSSKFTTKNQPFFVKLKELHERGVQMFYIVGNHDFHLKEVLSPYGVKLIADELTLDLPAEKKKIYIAHGDLVDQADVGYLRLRKIFRNPFVRALIQSVPGGVIEKVAAQLSRPPAQQHLELPAKWSAPDRERLRLVYRNFARQKISQENIAYVVLGHCHDLDEIEPFYWNMGYPPVNRQYLFYDSSGAAIKRRDFPRIS